MKHIKYCLKCKKYTLNEICSSCNQKTILPKPIRFSPEDKYGKYRRREKKIILKEKGLF